MMKYITDNSLDATNDVYNYICFNSLAQNHNLYNLDLFDDDLAISYILLIQAIKHAKKYPTFNAYGIITLCVKTE